MQNYKYYVSFFLTFMMLLLLLLSNCQENPAADSQQEETAPMAAFNASPTSGEAPLTVQFNDASMPGSNPITSWLWDFGDGQSSSEKNPQHTYSDSGSFDIRLTVSDGSLNHSKGLPNLINVGNQVVTAPSANFSAAPTSGEAPLTVTFSDQSTAGSSPITSWQWDFGDGNSSTAQNPQHTYADSGRYSISLTVSDGTLNHSQTLANLITVENQVAGAPVADFSANPTNGIAPLTVSFNDQSTPGTNPITSWSWDFGDGSSSTAENPQHSYSDSGRYDVQLTVSDGTLSHSKFLANLITVENQVVLAPQANFSANPTNGDAPLTVNFSDQSTPGTNPISAWFWDFGDGSISTEQNPQHTFTTAGNFTVSLTVSDGDLDHTYAPANLITVNNQNTSGPTADFTVDRTSGEAPVRINFTSTSTAGNNPIISWDWEFGDGRTSNDENPDHVYDLVGNYTVSLTVSDGSNSDTKAVTNLISGEHGDNSNHPHFEHEINQSGVVAFCTWRSQGTIDATEYGGNRPGDPAFPQYDAGVDGAKMIIMDGEDLSQLRYNFPFTNGSVWTQHEMMLDPILFTAPYDPLGMKIWRWRDDFEVECNDERRLTMNVSFGQQPHIYHRDGCAIPDREVKIPLSNGDYDLQPGGDTQCLYRSFVPHPNCFRWASGVWVRLTYHFDFNNGRLHIWAMRFDENVTRKIVDFAVPDWDGNWGFNKSGPWIHSTSRTHNEWPSGLPTGYIYARNLIISTQPIGF